MFLNPNDPAVIEEALKQGIPHNVIEAAQKSPVYKLAMDWKLAPAASGVSHLPMVWYVPPLSPISLLPDGGLPSNGNILPAVESAHPGAIPGESAERRRYRTGLARAETDDGDAPLQALANRRGRHRYPRH